MTDDAFERDLRAMLAARDPGPAHARLEAEVRARLASDLARRRWPAAIRWGIGAAALVSVTALVVALGTVRWSGLIDGGALPSPFPPFDPGAAGAGVVERPSGFPTSLLVTLAIVVVAVTARWVGGRWRRPVAVVLAALVGLGAFGIGTADFVEFDQGGWQYGLGFIADDPTPDDAAHDPGLLVQATFQVAPGGILTFGFDVHNRGTLPITIVGFTPQTGMAWGEVSAIGLVRNPDAYDIRDLATTRVFVPTQVSPDQRLFVVVAGRASTCALAPGRPPDPNGAGASFGSVEVVYEILGVRRVSTVQLPFSGWLPMNGTCMASR